MRRSLIPSMIVLSLLSWGALFAQQEKLSIPGISSTAPVKQFVAQRNGDAASVVANKLVAVDVLLRIDSGLHVHSHTPSSQFYIPTSLTLAPESGVVVKAIAYPPGQTYSFSFDPKEKLSVYVGDFAVKTTVLASAGTHTLHGTLRYQACDNSACYPPRNLPVSVVVIAR